MSDTLTVQPARTHAGALLGWANWLWFVDLPRRDCVLFLDVDSAAPARLSLEPFFGTALTHDGFDGTLPYEDASVDCIVITVATGSPSRMRFRGASCRELRRVLRPGGCLCVAGANPWRRAPR